ncbi:MAG TPA: VOC family protein [Candidatus Kapabacteria bacterium]
MATANPTLTFNGIAEEAFTFYQSVFGCEFTSLMRYSSIPGAEKWPPSEANRIAHIALPIGKSNVLMGGDAPSSFGLLEQGKNFAIELECESKEEASKLYYALAKGGEEDPMMPLGDAFWGAYYGQLTDKFGIRWMVNYTYPKK